MHDGVPSVSRRKENLKVGPQTQRCLGELAAVHPAGQPEIREEHANVGDEFKELQRFSSILRLEYSVVQFPKYVRANLAYRLVILDEQNDLVAIPRWHGGGNNLLFGNGLPHQAWKIDPHRRAFSGLAVDFHVTIGLLDGRKPG